MTQIPTKGQKVFGLTIKGEEDIQILVGHIRRYLEFAREQGEELEVEMTLEQEKSPISPN